MKYFEDITLGESESIDGYVITAEEITEFARKWDPQPMHVDPNAAQKSNFGGLIASGAHLIAIVVRQLVTSSTPIAVIGALGLDEVRFLEPVRPGDVIRLTRECIEVSPSTSKPDRGVVRNRITLSNQHGKRVLSYVDTLLVLRRPGLPTGD